VLTQDIDASLDDIAFRYPSEVNAHPCLCEVHADLTLVELDVAEIDVLALGLRSRLVGTAALMEIVVLTGSSAARRLISEIRLVST
jgi:hypothetical protein